MPKPPQEPKNQIELAEEDRGVFTTPEGPKSGNGVFVGTEGGVTAEELLAKFVADNDGNVAAGQEAFDENLDALLARTLVAVGGALSPAEDAAADLAWADLVASDNWSDIVDLGNKNDVINAGSGNDIVFGGSGNDQLRGDMGIDVLFGEAGNDVLDAGDDGDPDYLFGGVGDDVYKLRGLNDTVVENPGEGDDTIIWKVVGEDLDLGNYLNVENAKLTSEAGAVNLYGNSIGNRLTGNNSANTIAGRAGSDLIAGKGGNDLLLGDSDTNHVKNGSFEDLTGLTATEFGFIGNIPEWINSGAGTPEIVIDGWVGMPAADGDYWVDMGALRADVIDISQTIVGLENGETYQLSFQAGHWQPPSAEPDETMNVYWNGEFIAVIRPTVVDAYELFAFLIVAGSGDGTNTLRFEGVTDGSIDFQGVVLDDIRIVEAGNDQLFGGQGDDIMNGGAGDDFLQGDAGNDTLTGGDGADTFVFNCDIASEGGDFITDFNGAEGDLIDLRAVNLNGGDTIANLIAGGFIGVVGNQLFVDLDGGAITGGGDDILVATFTDGGADFNVNTDVLA